MPSSAARASSIGTMHNVLDHISAEPYKRYRAYEKER